MSQHLPTDKRAQLYIWNPKLVLGSNDFDHFEMILKSQRKTLSCDKTQNVSATNNKKEFRRKIVYVLSPFKMGKGGAAYNEKCVSKSLVTRLHYLQWDNDYTRLFKDWLCLREQKKRKDTTGNRRTFPTLLFKIKQATAFLCKKHA